MITDFSPGLNLIIGDKDVDFYNILNNIGEKISNYYDVHDYQLILKYLHKNDNSYYIIDNIFSELHPGKHREAAKKLHYEAKMNNKIIIASCYSPVAISAIPAHYVYHAVGDKIINNVDNSIGLNATQILSFHMGVDEYGEDVNNIVKPLEMAINDNDKVKVAYYKNKLEDLIYSPSSCPLVTGLEAYYSMSLHD